MSDTLTDELVNQVTWRIPNALALVGSRHGDEWNGMTTSWVTQVSMEPVLIGIGVDNKSVTHRLITASGAFTVNLWSPDDTRVFVKFSKPARYEDGKLNERPVRPGRTGCPDLRRGDRLDGVRGAALHRSRNPHLLRGRDGRRRASFTRRGEGCRHRRHPDEVRGGQAGRPLTEPTRRWHGRQG